MLQLHLHLQLVVVVVVMNESRLGLETRLFGSFLAAATLLLLFFRAPVQLPHAIIFLGCKLHAPSLYLCISVSTYLALAVYLTISIFASAVAAAAVALLQLLLGS